MGGGSTFVIHKFHTTHHHFGYGGKTSLKPRGNLILAPSHPRTQMEKAKKRVDSWTKSDPSRRPAANKFRKFVTISFIINEITKGRRRHEPLTKLPFKKGVRVIGPHHKRPLWHRENNRIYWEKGHLYFKNIRRV